MVKTATRRPAAGKQPAAAPSAPTTAPAPPATNGQVKPATKRRATAQALAAGQRDISVSEFFAKNRHLLGFDSPRKALLTSVKEAVDNSLDACEEAGILPEIWVRIEQVGESGTRYRMSVQDNGPGIVSKQIPLIFGKLLYGSKFHRLRMSRGQQGIGISAAGMYGVLTTGKPVKIISKIDAKHAAHYSELRIDTKTNQPEILNGKGDGVDIPAGKGGAELMKKHSIEWVAENDRGEPVEHGTRVTIEMEAKFQRGRGSVEEYLEQTAIANPHARIHFQGPDAPERILERSSDELPPEPKEIKPHPYGVELGRLVTMLQEHPKITLAQFLTQSFSRVSHGTAKKICDAAKLSTRVTTGKLGRPQLDALYAAMQDVSVDEGQSMTVLRYANRVPLQFQPAACAVTQTITSTNWRAYGLSQSRGGLPSGPVTAMVHVASVWVPFTSESKEAIASYPEIQKEIRLALQAVGRKLGMYMRRRLRVAQEGQRRSIFLRYLGEVATAVSQINGQDRARLYEQLLAVARKKTAEADVKLDDRGRPIQEEEELELGDNCIIVPPVIPGQAEVEGAVPQPARKAKGRRSNRATAAGVVAEAAVANHPAGEKATTTAAKKPAKKRR